MKKYEKYAMPFLTLLVCLIGWELSVHIFNISIHILPAPSDIIISLIENFKTLWMHSLVTLQESIVGLIIATLLAIITSIVMDLSNKFKLSVYPFLIVTQTIPVMVLGPLFTMWFGFGMTPKILMVILMCYFPIVISFSDALKQVNPDLINLMKSFNASKLQIYFLVKIPASFSGLFSGLKVAATYCMSGAIVGEWLNASAGLGYYMIRAKNGFMMDKVFACVLMIIILSLGLNILVSLIEKIVIPCKRNGGKKQ